MLYQRGKAYSQDLRDRVFAASDDGERVGEVAELLRVSVSYVSKALTRRRTTGETTVRSGRGHKPPKLAPFYAAIRAHVAERATQRSKSCGHGCWRGTRFRQASV
jgi:transposase